MKQLLRDIPGIRLALSLHAPTQELRLRIVPTAKAYPLDKLLEVLELYLKVGRVMIEYIVIGGVNDSSETAHALGSLFKNKDVIINLIPYNPTDVKENFAPPDPDIIVEFEKILQQDHGILATIRRTMGQDIEGACGQLVIKSGGNAPSTENSDENEQPSKETDRKGKSKIGDMEDLCNTTKQTCINSESSDGTNSSGTTESQSFWGNIFRSFF